MIFQNLLNIVKYLENSDYVVGNLEVPLGGEKSKYTYNPYLFNAPDKFALDLKTAGFSMLITANNHCLDRGIKGLYRTIDVLDKYNINHAGTYKTNKNRDDIFIKDIRNTRLNGADIIVVGTHPHIVQQVKVVNNKNKKKLIAYSLGNYIATPNSPPAPIEHMADIGIILYIYIDKYKDGKVSLDKVEIRPTKTIYKNDEIGKYITTVSIYDLIQSCDKEEDRIQLEEANVSIMRRVFNDKNKKIDLKSKYEID